MSCKKEKLAKVTRQKILNYSQHLKVASNQLFNGQMLGANWKSIFDEASELFDKILLESCDKEEDPRSSNG